MQGMIFDIQRWSLHDGPGIRTNVFLKGCPLSCLWCSNPESQDKYKELAFFKDKCIGCMSCVKDCPYNAIEQCDKERKIDYEICRKKCYSEQENAFACRRECYAEALKVMGKKVLVSDVMDEVMRDKEIYDSSRGGITITGGEPYAQPEFLLELLKDAKSKGVHTVIETSLYTKWKNIEMSLPFLDFMFLDFKLLNPESHMKYTGVDNELILENMKKISEYKRDHELEVVIRTPVIPGVNADKIQINEMAVWVCEKLPSIKQYQLLPYHRLGRGKYSNIGKTYDLVDTEVPSQELMEELEKVIEEKGLKIVKY